jgi:hypothetical protein
MRLICYPLGAATPAIRPAPADRPWMDATPQRFAYRCLPLTIANAHGWEVLNPVGFTAVWTGGERPADVVITPDAGSGRCTGMGHFGSAVLTFEMDFLLRTPPGWNLMAMGPINRPKDGIQALSGIMETDWSPYTFTMNWLFTRPHCPVRFEAGEPIAHLLPVPRGTIDAVQPEFRALADDPPLNGAYEAWRNSRSAFLEGLEARDPDVVRAKWQKLYHQGVMPDGRSGSPAHQTKVRARPFPGASVPQTPGAADDSAESDG